MIDYDINKVKSTIDEDLNRKIDTRTKPVGSLGVLEEVAFKIGRVQQTLTPSLSKPALLLFAGDHGIAEMGVSYCKQEVTYQMVINFINGGGAINVFCNQSGIDLKIIDAGVNYKFNNEHFKLGLIDEKIAYGTKNYYHEPAMSFEECERALQRSGSIVEKIHANGCNIISFGEMGIGNTSSSSIIMNKICGIPLKDCVGPGSGHDDAGVKKKLDILSQSIINNKTIDDPIEILRTFGGFDVAMMTGAMLKAAELGMIVLVDGFIATASYLVAHAINSNISDYTIFCHVSHEGGHKKMLDYLGVNGMLDLNLRLGEGTATALAYPLIQSSVNFLNEMASYDGAEVEKPRCL